MLAISGGMVTQCILLLLAAIVLRLWLSSRAPATKGPKIPGPTPLPLIGNLLEFVYHKLDVVVTVRGILDRYGGTSIIWVGPMKTMLISEPEHLQVFYTSPHLLDRAEQYDNIKDSLGVDSLFVANGDLWRRLRKIFMTTFSPTPLDILMGNFKGTQEYIVEKFRRHADGDAFKSWHTIRVGMTHSILKNAIGVTEPEEKIEWVLQIIENLSRVSYIRQFSPLLRYNITFDRMPIGRKFRKEVEDVHAWAQSLVDTAQAQLTKMQKNHESIPDLYIYNLLEKYRDTESMPTLRKEVLNLIVTGLDTTSGTIGFVMTTLGLYPELQEQVFQEDRRIQEEFIGRELEVEDYQKYELLERFIKETLRFFPIGPLIGRRAAEDVHLGNYFVAKDCNVIAVTAYTYLNPAIFPDPMKFDPDRHLPEVAAKRHPYAFNPFSAGPRGCPGQRYGMMAMKVVIPAIVREFKITSAYKSLDEALKNILAEVTLTDKGYTPIKLQTRNRVS